MITVKQKPLMNAVNIVPCSSSTAERERGFSSINIIVTNLRSNLLVQHVSALMFIKINGPPSSIWKAEKYVTSWLLHHRSAIDTRTCTHSSSDEHNRVRATQPSVEYSQESSNLEPISVATPILFSSNYSRFLVHNTNKFQFLLFVFTFTTKIRLVISKFFLFIKRVHCSNVQC